MIFYNNLLAKWFLGKGKKHCFMLGGLFFTRYKYLEIWEDMEVRIHARQFWECFLLTLLPALVLSLRVGRHRDGPDIIGMEHLRNKDRGRAVRRADDADGGCVLQVKAQQHRRDHRKENAELRRRAEEEHLRV